MSARLRGGERAAVEGGLGVREEDLEAQEFEEGEGGVFAKAAPARLGPSERFGLRGVGEGVRGEKVGGGLEEQRDQGARVKEIDTQGVIERLNEGVARGGGGGG